MKISIMIDTVDSFLHDYVTSLIIKIKSRNHSVNFITNTQSISKGDILFLLGCSNILTSKELSLNTHNIVIHPSKLPKGRGSAALVWEILLVLRRNFQLVFQWYGLLQVLFFVLLLGSVLDFGRLIKLLKWILLLH